MKVLLVEDDASLREGMGEIIAELAEVRAVGTEDEALAALKEDRFDLVITDLRIAGREQGGRAVLEAARRRQQPVAIVSAAAPDDVSRTLRPHLPDAVLVKPFQLDDMLTLVERFLGVRRELERVAQERRLPADGAWTETSPGMRSAAGGAVDPSLGGEGSASWVRLSPGGGLPWRPGGPGREAVLLVEGDLEVDGERHTAPRYLFMGAGQAPEARTREGCLAITLVLKG
ncbi:response regulator [Pyxidicoccus fallax]|uniref:Response regulator n=1 Tax=Pyxidicoccus fallax TaxID=394095 RepID=A0A848LRY5_9BACT|nr:response regulator [Pyxidicoccus fallax]NMO20419.1 response regulator [Pyxidicoccus fallax]NPC85025.1 response regulator [Pyxidicoccus fallax]